ncbi:MAG: Ig-like domain-containing protein [Solirubrobacteraceae bacterium]
MMARSNIARGAATALVAAVVLIAALPGSALAAAPELTIGQPTSGSATDQQTPPFAGTTTDTADSTTLTFDPVTLEIFAGPNPEGTLVQAWTTLAPTQEGVLDTWEITPGTPLEQGQYTAVAKQTNAETGPGVSAPVTFTVETRPVVTLTSPGEGAVLKVSEPTLTGSAGMAAWDQSVKVAIHEGSSLAGPEVASGSVAVSGGTWSYSPHLSDGIYTAQAEQSDEVGDTGTSAAVTFTVDTTAPVVTVTSPGENAVLKVSDPTLKGGAGAVQWDHQSVAVTIHEGSSLAGGVVVSDSVPVSDGQWSYPVTSLNDGVYTVQAEQTDEAGNKGTSAPVTFTVDTLAPVVSMNALVPSLTKDATPTLTGSAATASWDDQSVTVAIHEGESAGGHVVTSGSAPVIAGAWSYSVAHLNDGTYTAQAAQGDEAGHTGRSNAVTFTVDATPPAVSLTKPANHAELAVSEPTFSGFAGHASGDEPSITLKIYEDEGGPISGAPVQEVKGLVPNAAHEWTTGSTGPRLSNGIYVAVAEQVDEAGNIGTSKATTFTIGTRSPEVTLDTSGFVVRGTRLLTGPTPSFSGTGATESEDGDVVSVNVYSGTSASGIPVRSVNGPLSGSAWTTPPVQALPDGTYTVQAEQTDANPFSQTGVSNTATFTVDADPPNVTLTSPSNGSSTTSSTLTFSGAAGVDAGDLPAITVRLYSGSTIAGTPLEAVTVQASEGSWSAVFGGLSPGTYTAQAEQSDDVGNVGRSEPVTFTLTSAPVTPHAPPVASFRWVPSAPHPTEPVTLISTSTDPDSSITGFAWAPGGNGVFTQGESALTTTFATAGAHVVQLQVTDANGLSSVVAETIPVTAPAVPLIQPFPIVRMAGSYNSVGVKISLLTVQAPVGATVTVKCRGIGCPTKSETVVVASRAKSKPGAVLITLRRFERPLHAGAILVIEVSDHGEIGKFTRFVIHHGKLPSRQDLCLNPVGVPIQCPS